MVRKLVEQKKFNNFHIQGKLVDNPVKQFNEDNQILVFFKLRTRFNNTYVDVPLVITGSSSDAFATLYQKGDQIEVDGMFVSLNGNTTLWVTNYILVKKCSKQKEVINKFQEVCELYSLEGIERREKNGKRKS